MLRVGIIGYGRRIAHMAKEMGVYHIPYIISAVADPRAAEIQAQRDPFLASARFYTDADSMLAQEELDGVMIGTRCYLHTEMACRVAPYKLPLFLEKPVAITFEQLKMLAATFEGYPAPVVVSFPLRLTPIVQTVKEMLQADLIGSVEHVVAVNDVPYGDVYYRRWYRNYEEVGGLWLQKATHDFDYINYLLGQKPLWVAAMDAQRIYGGEKPFDLRCADCPDWEACPESPFNLFYQRFQGDEVEDDRESMCLFAQGIRNQDSGNCLIEYENGVQLCYSQNFFARFRAARRGVRLYGYRGTIDFDWYQNAIHLYKHHTPAVETIDFTGEMPHFGGDRELCLDFLRAMRDRVPSRSPLEAGILSALTCLWARESARTRRFCEVVMPA